MISRFIHHRLFRTTLCVCIFSISTFLLEAQNKTKAEKLVVEPATLTSLGFEWYIQGDDNRNASAQIYYRETGEPGWHTFLPMLRIGNEKCGVPDWNFTTENMFAGSIFNLKPNTKYECRIHLSDPDGIIGEAEKIVTLVTRKKPEISYKGRVRHVYPENWDGKREEPSYNGLLHAYFGYQRYADWILTTDPVQPGDVILVHAGEYKADFTNYRDFEGLTFDGTYFLTKDGTEENPIVLKSAGDGEVIFDGNGSAVLFDVTAADHNYLQGLTFRNTNIAIRAGLMNAHGCDGLIVEQCNFFDIGIGIQAQYEGSRGFYIADNSFIGREDTSMVYHHKIENGKNVQRIASYYAIKIHGQGHTVCYNTVKYFFDGIDICTHARPENDPQKKAVSIDFYNNDIFLCNDNFIEADGGNHNIRILRNRCFNSGQQALSNQPVLGGPVYWVRNVVYNCGDASTFKFWGMYPAGILAYHNTSSGILTRDDKPASNVHFRNNLFLPSDDATMPTLGLYSYTSYSTLDYNGYRKREPFIGYRAPVGKMRDFNEGDSPKRFLSLAELNETTGQEKHGMEVDYDIFIKATPTEFKDFNKKHEALGRAYPIYQSGKFDFRLRDSSKPVDAGVLLPGVNTNYTGKAPDLGAYEIGIPIPHYGRRDLNKQPEDKGAWDNLLENGLENWRGFNQTSVPSNWCFANGELSATGFGDDIITKAEYADFIMEFEYNISKGGNSGVFFHVQEGESYDEIWHTGIEFQLIDNDHNPLAQKDSKNKAGSVYALYAAGKDKTKSAGEWNKVKIEVLRGIVKYWMNDELINQFELWTSKWYMDREQTLHNKTRKPDWGEFCKGHIAIQDEGYKIKFRNIKIKPLSTN
nr:family 16 glycoside hydrolase [uncultured Draconibacterium sp.]